MGTVRALLRRVDLWAFLGCVALFASVPELDLAVSGWLYDPARRFFLADHALVQASYLIFAQMGGLAAAALIGYWAWRRFLRRDGGAAWQRRVAFLVIVLAVGPGLIVNSVLKTHSGRARPLQVEMFGGDRPFTPPAVLADACERNCSFVSGHAATAFSLIAVAWVARNRWWLLGGAVLGALVGLGRMAQGGHFLSDIVFAFWVTYLVALLAARLVLGQRSITGAPRPAGPDAR